MSSFFKSKRSNTDAKSLSKASNVTEPDSKTHKGPSSAAPLSKTSTGTVHSPPAAVHTCGGVAPNSKQAAAPPPASQSKDRKVSVDMQEWMDTEYPVDSRIMATTMQNNSLSISRSGRYKAKGKQRTRLFSAEDVDGGGSPQDDQQPVRGSTSLSTPEDRQTVLDVMAKRTGAAATPVQSLTTVKQSPAGGTTINKESGANRKSSDRGTAASKWSTTSNSTDL